jgi:hypothetical protein
MVDPARLALLYEVSRSFSELIEIDRLMPFMIARTKELLQAESRAVMLLDEAAQEFFPPYTVDIGPDVERRFAAILFPADKGLAGRVLQHGVPQLILDVTRARAGIRTSIERRASTSHQGRRPGTNPRICSWCETHGRRKSQTTRRRRAFRLGRSARDTSGERTAVRAAD